jgi:hypothetical protein
MAFLSLWCKIAASSRKEPEMLTPDQVAEYHEKGFVAADYRLSEGKLESIRRDHDRELRKKQNLTPIFC